MTQDTSSFSVAQRRQNVGHPCNRVNYFPTLTSFNTLYQSYEVRTDHLLHVNESYFSNLEKETEQASTRHYHTHSQRAGQGGLEPRPRRPQLQHSSPRPTVSAFPALRGTAPRRLHLQAQGQAHVFQKNF